MAELFPPPPVLDPPPITVTVSSSTGTGPGTIITAPGRPNIILKVLSPVRMVGKAALKTFIQTLIGVLTAGPATGLVPATDFTHYLVTSASLSVGAGVVAALQEIARLLNQ